MDKLELFDTKGYSSFLELAFSSNTSETVKRARDFLDFGVDPIVLMFQLASLITYIITRNQLVRGVKFIGATVQETERHCYSRVLELLVNVWAYHNARRIVYINSENGVMLEQHKMKSRRGKMWVRWFSFSTLKSVDEDLAEEADSEAFNIRWIWPSTSEVFWLGTYDKEKTLRQKENEKKRKQSRDKLERMKKRMHQKALSKFVKPLLEETKNSNVTVTLERR